MGTRQPLGLGRGELRGEIGDTKVTDIFSDKERGSNMDETGMSEGVKKKVRAVDLVE